MDVGLEFSIQYYTIEYMVDIPKITQKEWDQYVEPQMEARGLNRVEREALKGAFYDDLHDVDYGEHQPIFGKPVPHITEDELKTKMEQLRNPYSPVSKSLKTQVHPSKLDVAEEVLKEAIKGGKERRLF